MTPGRAYFYIVAAVDGNGNRGAWSERVSVTVPGGGYGYAHLHARDRSGCGHADADAHCFAARSCSLRTLIAGTGGRRRGHSHLEGGDECSPLQVDRLGLGA